MENFKNLVRSKFPENKADVGGSKDQKMSIQKSQSLKEKKKGENWLQRQFMMRKKSGDYGSKELEHATAVAAAAYAISSQEISEIPQKKTSDIQALERPLNKTKSKTKEDATNKSLISQLAGSKRLSGSLKLTEGQGKKEATSSSVMDVKKPEKVIISVPSKQMTLTKPTPMGESTEADTWEKTQLENIKQKYDKLNETINSWENQKKLKAKRKLNMQESEMERTRVKAMDKFRKEMQNIEEIARGARQQGNERRKNEELQAKEKANSIRTTGRLSGTFSCF